MEKSSLNLQSVGLGLIAKILQEGDVREFVKLNKSYLGSHEVKIYTFVDKYIKKYGTLPSLKLACSKTELEPVEEKDSLKYFKDEFTTRALHGRLIEDVVPKLNELCVKGTKTEEAVKKIKNFALECETITQSGADEIKSAHELGGDVLNFVREARTHEGLTGVTTGWNFLDRQTKGFQKGGLYVIVARMKAGKSQMMSLMSNAAHDDGNVPLVVSMEMKLLQWARRQFAMKARIDMDCMKEGRISTFAERRLEAEIETYRGLQPFHFIEGQFKKDIHEIAALIQNLKPNIVYIDGAYLLKILGNVPKWERVTEIAETLKTTASNCNIPLVVSFQLSREATKTKTVGFEHIHLSDAIGQLAEAVIGIFATPPNEESEIEERDDVRYIDIIGGREGESGTFAINWDWSRQNFSEIEEDELY